MMVSPQALADTLRRRHGAEREEQALRAARLRELLKARVADAKRAGLLTRAWLIGSLNSAHFGPHSDVDLVVEGLVAASGSGWWASLCQVLQTEVDLLELEQLPASFTERVLREGLRLDAT
jgi:predicted nucleotidyltransferase